LAEKDSRRCADDRFLVCDFPVVVATWHSTNKKTPLPDQNNQKQLSVASIAEDKKTSN
jgi:hypothetical protein